MAFIGSGVTLKEVGKIEYGPGLVIDQGCFVDALSNDGIRFGTAVSLNKHIIIECTGSLANIGKGLVIGDNVGLVLAASSAAPAASRLAVTPSSATSSASIRKTTTSKTRCNPSVCRV